VAFWGTKAAICLKHVKIEAKLPWTAYRNSQTLFRTVPSPTPDGLPFLEIGVCNLTSLPPFISGTGKATDFKFGGNIYRANPNKSPLKIWEKMERGLSSGRDCPCFGVPPIISGTGKAIRTSHFVGTFIGSIGTKVYEKCWDYSSRGRSQRVPKIFRACIRRIARSSLR